MSTPAVDSGLLSRKFIVTIAVVVCTTVLAAYERMDANVGLAFGACIAAFNWANLRHHQHYDEDDE